MSYLGSTCAVCRELLLRGTNRTETDKGGIGCHIFPFASLDTMDRILIWRGYNFRRFRMLLSTSISVYSFPAKQQITREDVGAAAHGTRPHRNFCRSG